MNFDGFFFGSLHFSCVQRYRNNEGKKRMRMLLDMSVLNYLIENKKIVGNCQSKSLSQWPICFYFWFSFVVLIPFNNKEVETMEKKICQNSHFIGTLSTCTYLHFESNPSITCHNSIIDTAGQSYHEKGQYFCTKLLLYLLPGFHNIYL